MTTAYNKPLPNPGQVDLTKPFWEAAKRGQLVMPRCKKCNHLFWFPRDFCPRCLYRDVEWAPVSGRGRVFTFTIVYQPAHPAFQEEAPYPYAVIQLDEGPRMISRIVGCKNEDVKVDMPVVAVFDAVTPEWTLVKFKPA